VRAEGEEEQDLCMICCCVPHHNIGCFPQGQGHAEKWKVANKDGTMVYGQDFTFLQEWYSSAWIPTPQKGQLLYNMARGLLFFFGFWLGAERDLHVTEQLPFVIDRERLPLDYTTPRSLNIY